MVNVKLMEGVTNEDMKYLCDFMGIDAVKIGDGIYRWSDSPYFSTHENDYYKCMSNIWRYIWERKLGDWNFVMSVVDKIGSGNVCSVGGYYFRVVIDKDKCSIYRLDRLGYVHIGGEMVFSGSGIKCVVDACLSFAKWYIDNKDRG